MKHLKIKIIFLALAVLLVISISSTVSATAFNNTTNNTFSENTISTNSSNNTMQENRTLRLQILALNDFHGALEPRVLRNRSIGGAAVIAGYLNKWEKEAAKQGIHTVRVHAGDMIGASPPISALLQNEPTMRFLEMANFRFGTPGNHEFNEGVKELLRLQYGGSHPKTEPLTGRWRGTTTQLLAANVIDRQTRRPILPPYRIIEVEGIKVGFIGAVLERTPTIVMPGAVATIDFLNKSESVNKYVRVLKDKGVETIIVLLHQGGRGDRKGGPITGEIVDTITAMDDEVDVVITGDTHTGFWGHVGNKIVTQAFAHGTAFADIDLVIDRTTRDVVRKNARIIDTFHDPTIPVIPKIEEMLNSYRTLVAPIVNRVVGTAANNLTNARNEAGESALGNLIADAQRRRMGTELAFMNPGGIRTNIEAGEVTWGELFTVQPFSNDLVKMKLTGTQIDTLLEQQWIDQPFPRILQVSGLSYSWNPAKPVGERVDPSKIIINGRPLEKERLYSVTVNSFLAAGGDRFSILINGTKRKVGPLDLNALIEFLQHLPQPFSYSIKGRINTGISVSPSNLTLPINGTRLFTGGNVTWSVGNATVGSINATTGLFKALAPGTTNVTARSGNITGNATVTVTPPPVATASLRGGNFRSSVTVNLTSSRGFAPLRIFFTTDGSTPTNASRVFNGTPLVFSRTTTLRFFAQDRLGTNSTVFTETYNVYRQVAYTNPVRVPRMVRRRVRGRWVRIRRYTAEQRTGTRWERT